MTATVERLSPRIARVEPPAKLNLWLEVLRRRDDGYHEIETVMQAIDLRDLLTVERLGEGPGLDLAVRGYPSPAGAANLVAKAAGAYFAAAGEDAPRFALRVELVKKIPPGAGLGGGSSDAAGMLAALDALADRPLGQARLLEIAATLGSDVPFFLVGGRAIARGRGERIEALPDPPGEPFCFVVLYPGVTSPTPAIYKSLRLDLTIAKRDLHPFLESLGRPFDRRHPPFYNALSAPFRREYPALGRLQDEVSRGTGRAFFVSGSGSALFALVEDALEAESVRRKLQAMAAGDSFLCRSLARTA